MRRVTRPKARPGSKLPLESVQAIARVMKRRMEHYANQDEFAEFLGTSQPTVSKFLGTIDEKKPQPYFPGNDLVSLVTSKLKVEYEGPRVGMRRADVRETNDMLPNRGRAMDTLSEEYPSDVLERLRAIPPPAGHEKWSYVRWLDYFLKLKTLLEAGS